MQLLATAILNVTKALLITIKSNYREIRSGSVTLLNLTIDGTIVVYKSMPMLGVHVHVCMYVSMSVTVLVDMFVSVSMSETAWSLGIQQYPYFKTLRKEKHSGALKTRHLKLSHSQCRYFLVFFSAEDSQKINQKCFKISQKLISTSADPQTANLNQP